MSSPEISFYFPIEQDIAAMERLSVDRDWSFFNCGRRNWILQTMMEIGNLVPSLNVSSVAPGRGVVILHSDDFYTFWNACAAYGRMRIRAGERASAFTREATRKKWVSLLTAEIPDAYDRWVHSLRKRLPLSIRKRLAEIRTPRSSLYTV